MVVSDCRVDTNVGAKLGLTFSSALAFCRLGGRIYRDRWFVDGHASQVIRFLEPGDMRDPWGCSMFVLVKCGRWMPYTPTAADMTSDDWNVFGLKEGQ